MKTDQEKAKAYTKKKGWEYIEYNELLDAYSVKVPGKFNPSIMFPRLLILKNNRLVAPTLLD